ncbi:hypothetical protein Aab01nite_20140 [Paractinoplanes abujensis]|uniref:Uncharacterized protein n=1 Tax=Paractinoplanes abujensis TaxID=882441 RepID=A0A7W7G5K9_9ACTN|nr:hypothetical protein [Actinoplanes abujensis]MBB4697102.1 hypothetical protein [Actinoplanes abujensis]GID18424.1 hypothetical protein Aab01nite_20140 [Actinoplanes abujensis]
MPALAVLVFALAWWAACYLAGRDPVRPAALRSAGALITYAAGVALWTADPRGVAAQVLLCLPVLLWAGAMVALLPSSVPERRQIDLGWMILAGAFLVTLVVLPSGVRLVVLAPLAGGLLLLWRFRDQVRPPMLTAALTVAAALYALALAAVLLPIDLGRPGLALAAMGLDLLILGFLIAVSDALDAGERLRPDLVRSATAAVVVIVLVGGPAAVTLIAVDDTAVTVLQFLLVAAVMTVVGLEGPVRRGLDVLAFRGEERLRQDRSALLLLAEALPRHRQRHRLLATGEEEFLRFARQALANYGDLGRLMRSPLTDLPAVDRRLTGRALDQPLERAVELRALLKDRIDRLRPAGPFETTDEWRHYNALHFCTELGLNPYGRKLRTDGLDRDARQALDWMRRYVPRGTLRRWHNEAAALVASGLWDELITTDPRLVARQRGNRSTPTRST